jgi:hypothetical protein
MAEATTKTDHNEFIEIENPTTKGTAKVTRRSFETLWKSKGWKIAKSSGS